jgi:hypothetical protein
MATKKTTKKAEAIFLAKWNTRTNGKVEQVAVKVKKVGNKYIALDGETKVPEWAEIVTLN